MEVKGEAMGRGYLWTWRVKAGRAGVLFVDVKGEGRAGDLAVESKGAERGT